MTYYIRLNKDKEISKVNDCQAKHTGPVVSSYSKKPGGFPGMKPNCQKRFQGWLGHGISEGKVTVDSYHRGNAEPTPREKLQKKVNNSLAAKGSSKRVWVSPKGKTRVMSKDKAKHMTNIERVKGAR